MGGPWGKFFGAATVSVILTQIKPTPLLFNRPFRYSVHIFLEINISNFPQNCSWFLKNNVLMHLPLNNGQCLLSCNPLGRVG